MAGDSSKKLEMPIIQMVGQMSECEYESESESESESDFGLGLNFEGEFDCETELVVNCQNGWANALGQFSSLTGRQRCGSRGGERSGLGWIMAASEQKQKRIG